MPDAHHHVWNLDHRPQPWLDEAGHELIRRTFGLDDLRSTATRLLAGRQLTSTVVVQCITSVVETPERLMFGSDRPLCVLAGGWNRWAATVEVLLSGCSAIETDAVLADTATTFYGLTSAADGRTAPCS
ncbi:amidohydrolase family protein [Nonomuraea sp. NPDC049625]|uniref:amidohydrolase family protein n=1 Tax=Nonomuraea sp. NPDC049625 TaxID=3155775 RepID=UPI00342EFC88